MLQLFLTLFLAFACPSNKHYTDGNGTTITAQDTGGDNGHTNPNPPPTPPSGN